MLPLQEERELDTCQEGSPNLPTMAAREKERASNGARKGERFAAGVEEYYRKRERAKRAERERDGRRERGRGSTRRPRLRRSLSAGAVAGPSCPVPRSPCSPLSVSDPVVSSYELCTVHRRHRRHRRCHHRYICSNRKVLTLWCSIVSCQHRTSLSLSFSFYPSLFLFLFLFPFLGLLFVESTIERIARRPRPR